MRNRHLPRLCGDCQAPMAGHKDTCWRCRPRRIAHEVAGPSPSEARLDAERWTNEGGSFASDAPAPMPAMSARG